MNFKVKSISRLISIICIMALAIPCISLSGCSNTITTSNTTGEKKPLATEAVTSDYKAPEVPDNAVNVVIDVKDYGKIEVALYPDEAPITVENFVKLAKDGFYDGLTFHRIMEGFMIQGGDPNGDGTGGSKEEIKGEFSINGVQNTITHTRGAISMARSGNSYDSASSQFFIVHEDSTFLDGQYAGFGYVTKGMEVVDAIAEDAKPIDNNGTIKPDEQPVINTVKVVE